MAAMNIKKQNSTPGTVDDRNVLDYYYGDKFYLKYIFYKINYSNKNMHNAIKNILCI